MIIDYGCAPMSGTEICNLQIRNLYHGKYVNGKTIMKMARQNDYENGKTIMKMAKSGPFVG